MAHFERRPGGWLAQIRLVGKPSQSKTFPTKAQAKAWANEIEQETRDSRLGIINGTLQDVIDKYITDVCPKLKSGENIRKRLLAIAKKLPVLRQVSEITPADLVKFRDVRMKEVSPATVLKEMTILRSLFESARRDWSMISKNPISDVKRPPMPPSRKRLMMDDERDRMLMSLCFDGKIESVTHQVAVIMLLALETAMRAGEIVGLTWERVNFEGRYVSLDVTKNGDHRDVPLSARAVELLMMARGLDPVKVFTITSASLDVLFRRARDRCEIKALHFHDTRATALTRLSKKLDIMELARMVGHRDLKSLMIYFRTTATDLAAKLG